MKKTLLVAGILLANSAFAQLYTPSGATQSTTNSSSNNVGVGTNNPLAPLDIRGRILISPDSPIWGVGIRGYSTYWSRGYNFLNSDGTIKIGGFGAAGPKDGVDSYFIGKEWNDNIVRFYTGDNRSIFYGNIGVGIETPQYKLDVVGDAQFRDVISGGNNSWIFHTPDDGRKTLHIAYNNAGTWDWGKAFVLAGDTGNASLQGKLEAKQLKVTLTPTADFVFAEDYNLPKLEEVEKHIKEKKHLPEIASAQVMEKEGVNVGEFQIKLLQKIEELTLYVIEQNKQIKEDKLNLKVQSEKISELEKELNQLKLRQK